jgi:hypothetical protein
MASIPKYQTPKPRLRPVPGASRAVGRKGSRLAEAARRAGRGFTTSMDYGHDTTPDELEFMKAVEDYKRRHVRPYPTSSEILAVVLELGYRKPDQE